MVVIGSLSSRPRRAWLGANIVAAAATAAAAVAITAIVAIIRTTGKTVYANDSSRGTVLAQQWQRTMDRGTHEHGAFKLSAVTSLDEFRRVVDVEYAAFEQSHDSLWAVYRGPTREETTERQWHESACYSISKDGNSDSNNRQIGTQWIRVEVVDSESTTGNQEVVGAAQWTVHQTSPFSGHEAENGSLVPDFSANWWPDDDAIHYVANQLLSKAHGERAVKQRMPHVQIELAFAAPTWSDRGVEKLCVEHVLGIADEKRLPCFVDAAEPVRPVYESLGFQVLKSFDIDASVTSPNAEWNVVRAHILPKPYKMHHLWRPAKA